MTDLCSRGAPTIHRLPLPPIFASSPRVVFSGEVIISGITGNTEDRSHLLDCLYARVPRRAHSNPWHWRKGWVGWGGWEEEPGGGI